MQVYKAFFKVIYKHLTQIMIYMAVFFGLTIALTYTYNDPTDTNFTGTKVNIAFINHDKNSELVEGLKGYLDKNTNIVDIKDDTQKLQDALFFKQVEYIVKVPAGFTEGLLAKKQVQLEKTTLPGSASGVYVDSLVNKYLNTVKTYNGYLNSAPMEQIVSYVDKDLEQKADVKLNVSMAEKSTKEKCQFYYNFLAYSIFAILILGVCSVMIVFNNKDLKKRNLCSPTKLKSMNFQMILGNISYAVLAWFVMIFASIIMYGGFMFTARGLLFLLNSLVFTIAALSISFLIGNVIKSRAAMSAATNVISLGTCFISGVFVPQELLGKTVLTIANFTPNYWYVKSNDIIANMINFNMENMTPIFINMLIMIGFALAMLAVALVVIKQKRMSY
ncbi:MAG: ABC transporter permease [Bacillota bacterium]|nr:ABC transporter permease [Bacillota bacterium]